LSQAKIIVVESERSVASDLKERLLSLGFSVVLVDEVSEESLSLCLHEHPDLVIVDIECEGTLRAVNFAREMRTQYQIPVIALITETTAETVENARSVDPYGLLAMPIEDCSLQATIESALFRHQSEKQIRRREQYLRSTLKSIDDAVIFTDDSGSVTFMNVAAERLTRLSLNDVLGKDISAVFRTIDPLGSSSDECPVQRAIKDGCAVSHDNQLALVGARKKQVYVDFTVTPSVDEAETRSGSVLILRDAQEKHKVEQLLVHAKEKYLSLLYGITDGFVVTDEVGTITFANKRVSELLGVNGPTDLLGSKLEIFLDPGSFSDQARTLSEALRNPEFFDELELTLVRQSDSTIRTVEMKPSAVTANGRLVGVQALLTDITERRRIEQELARYRHHLEDLVLERTNQLAESNAKLRRAEKMESVGLLAGGIAHDLNNLLGPQIGYLEMVLMKMSHNDPNRIPLERTFDSAKKAADIIQDILTLARRGRFAFSPSSLNRVVKDYVKSSSFDELRQRFPDISVKCDLDECIPSIRGSKEHIEKVILSLVTHAFESVGSQGDITIRTSCNWMDRLSNGHKIERPGEYVCFGVSDTGDGYTKEDMERLFEPYYSKRQMQHAGSGLELAVVYGIVKDHEGYYDIMSRPGEGTEILLYLPVAPEEVHVRPSAKLASGAGEKILVVDDTPEHRTMTCDMVKMLGYDVSGVGSGKEAVSYVRCNHVDLVVMDMILLGKMDGCDVYEELIKVNKDLKAVIVSGYSSTVRVQRALSAGAGSYLKKPFSVYSLARAISDSLNGVESPTIDADSQEALSAVGNERSENKAGRTFFDRISKVFEK